MHVQIKNSKYALYICALFTLLISATKRIDIKNLYVFSLSIRRLIMQI